MDHKAEFGLLVMRTLGAEVASTLDWSAPRVICVANSFTKYDEHAVQQMGRNIELVRYQDFAGKLLSFDLVKAGQSAAVATADTPGSPAKSTSSEKTAGEYLASAPQALKDLFEDLGNFIESLGDDVTATERRNYFAYRRIRNFACASFRWAADVRCRCVTRPTCVLPDPLGSGGRILFGHPTLEILAAVADVAAELERHRADAGVSVPAQRCHRDRGHFTRLGCGQILRHGHSNPKRIKN